MMRFWRRNTAAAELTGARPSSFADARTAAVTRLLAPVDIAPLVYFRITFGAILLYQVWRYFDSGWIGTYWLEPDVHFKYYGFEAVTPWPGDLMYVHFYVLGVAAACIMLGLWYRAAAVVFFLGFTYQFLLDQATYLNHFYLIILVSFLLIFVPANRAFSVDARLNPGLHSETAPAWTLYLLRAQIGIVYFYGGVAKLSLDWLHGEPMRSWLEARTNLAVIGPLLDDPGAAYFFSYGGLIFDLSVVFLLLYGPTRLLALILAVAFNLTNHYLFDIGIFSWFMIAGTMLFLPPASFRLRGLLGQTPVAVREPEPRRGLNTRQWAVAGCIALYLSFQLIFPFRHYLYPGNVAWTEEGHRFSWHMKLRGKTAIAQFTVVDPQSGQTWGITNADYLNEEQERKMSSRPDMILQFAHHLAHDFQDRGYDGVEVYVDVWATLNDRRPQRLIDPTVDLASVERSLKHAYWIVPLYQPRR